MRSIARCTCLLTYQREVSTRDVMAFGMWSHVEVAGIPARRLAFSDDVVLDDWLQIGFVLWRTCAHVSPREA